MRTVLPRTACASLLLATVLTTATYASTVSVVALTLPKLVAGSELIVVGTVEPQRDGPASPPHVCDIRVSEVLKAPASIRAQLIGRTLRLFDLEQEFARAHADLIAAGVISYVVRRYSTTAPGPSAGDRLIFFIGQPAGAPDPPYFLSCSGSNEPISAKRAVLRALKRVVD